MSYQVQDDRRAGFDRVSQELAEILSDLASAAAREERRTRPARRSVVAEINGLIADMKPGEEDAFMRTLAESVQNSAADSEILLQDADVTTTMAMARPSIGVSGGCVGRDGGGIEASFGGTTVKICVIGSLDAGIQGGGIEITHSY